MFLDRLFFKNVEEVKRFDLDSNRIEATGYDDCIARTLRQKARCVSNRSAEVNLELYDTQLERVLKVIGSSDKVHVVDALAITGEEGRGSLR